MQADHRLLLFALGLLAGCTPPGGDGTDSGNALQAELFVAGEGAVAGARDVATLTRAELVLTEVEFAPCSGGGEDNDIDYEGDYRTDLLGGTTLPVIELTIDSVCEVEVEAEPNGEPSIVVEGSTTDGATFLIESDDEWKFEVESDLTLQGTLNRLALLFDLDVWMEGVDPDLGTPGGDGVIRIDAANNTALFDVFTTNVASTGRLEREDD